MEKIDVKEVKWYESEYKVQSSDRIGRMIVIIVFSISFSMVAIVGCIKFYTSGGCVPSFSALCQYLGYFTGAITIGSGLWKGVAASTEKFDEPKKE